MLTAQTLEEFKERTSEKLRGVRCPVHGQPPKLRFQGSSLREVSIQISACCATLMEEANRAIAVSGAGLTPAAG